MTIFYFTGTGNSLAVAKRIGGTLISIPHVVDSGELRYSDDAIGVVFPIYSFSAPKMVRRFLDKAQFQADYTFAIGTYGYQSGAAMLNVQKQAQKNGYRFDYANHLQMLDNYLPLFEMGKEMEKLPGKKTEEKLTTILNDINSRQHRKAGATPGIRAFTALLNATHSYDHFAAKYHVDDQCNQCGTCAKVCPAKNIAITDAVRFGDHCEACFSCLHHCPQNAVHLNREKSNKRWRNPDVSLKEIIDANNRNID
jgi:Pyruvate/2-oxoacid:ferredoxin oxidoreductase delta subunit/flavodoxin